MNQFEKFFKHIAELLLYVNTFSKLMQQLNVAHGILTLLQG